MKYLLRKADPRLRGRITLAGSKSIANRVLIIRALCGEDFEIRRLAEARDTRLLRELLQSEEKVRDAGAAGTTFRFLTAFLSMQPGRQLLTGTERMKQRPVGLLVEALRSIGAQIEYAERQGFPPLWIGPPSDLGRINRIRIPASTSSQYISALLMIAPVLPQGLEITLEGKVVSRPYIDMTLALMRYFGVDHHWEGERIIVPPQRYRGRPFTVEADWSAASYYYAMAAFAEEVDLMLAGLYDNSIQGDAVLPRLMEPFGIETDFRGDGVRLTKKHGPLPGIFEWDFLRCPDLAQTLAVVCAGLGVEGRFAGLETLRIKETDRIAALQRELAKVEVKLGDMPGETTPGMEKRAFCLSGKAVVRNVPSFATYEDHRMAMAFTPLAQFGEIAIEEPGVVEKSYPGFWEDIERLGFEVKK